MARPTARVLTLLEVLQSGGIRTLGELAERLEVDQRTVRRYVEHLIDLGVPVESVRGRYGGYRLAAGYRMPPLMLSDEEALAVLLGLIGGRHVGLATATGFANETATAKIRRVLPERLGRRLDAVLDTLTFTRTPKEPPAPDSQVLLSVADAIHQHRPIAVKYTDREGRRSTRTLHPHGLVVHSGRWYVAGVDPTHGEDRTLRLDRIADARVTAGSFEPPAGYDTAQRVLSGFAEVAYRHHVVLRIQAPAEHIRTRLPESVATIATPPLTSNTDTQPEPWLRVELHAERLDWLPPLLASLDRPFAIEHPDELRSLVAALANRLIASARRNPADL